MKVVTYNLRYASESDPQPWSRRREPMIALLRETAPAILATQEGLDHQLADLEAGLRDQYRLVSKHRHDDGPEENSAIFYATTQVELIEIQHRWLSDTPDVPGSITWGTTLPRMYSLATFRRHDCDTVFYVINTHFDHASTAAQLNSAHQLTTQIAALDPDRPLFLLGDFNNGEDSEPYGVLIGSGLRDAYLDAPQRGPRVGTFNNYQSPEENGTRIDWILVNDHVRTEKARMIDCAPGGQYPSDHLPVEAGVTLHGDCDQQQIAG